MSNITHCLWFRAEAEEAAKFYTSIFPSSKIGNVMRGAPGSPAIAVEFTLNGESFLALNGRAESAFTDAHSLLVNCDSQAEIDRYWDALTKQGKEVQCGWLTDRFGVSWQIVPRNFGTLLGGSDAASQRAFQAMLGMKKIDIAALERARKGDVSEARSPVRA